MTGAAGVSSFLPSFLGASLANQQTLRQFLVRLICLVMALVIIIVKIIFIFMAVAIFNCSSIILSSSVAQNSQQVEEDLNDIDVEQHGSQNVLIDRQLDVLPSHYQLSVDYQVHPEDKHSKAAVEVLQKIRVNE
jgi:hypothetical protein